MRVPVRVVCVLQIAALGLWVWWVSKVASDLSVFSSRSDGLLHFFQVVTLLGVIATIVPIIAALRSLFSVETWWWVKVHNALVLLASVAFAWFVLVFHLLDWSLRY